MSVNDPYDIEPKKSKTQESSHGRNDGSTESSQADIHHFRSNIHEILFVGIVCIAQLATQASLGQTINLVHIIGDHFETMNPGNLNWFVAGYSLTVGSFILVFGRFGDHFGHKRMFTIGLAWFSFWSMVCGLSSYSNYVLFIFSRVFQGKCSGHISVSG